MRRLALLAALSLAPAAALAGEADVVGAEARSSGGGWSFDVTVRHADTGWEHYADAWRVVGPDGVVYGTRVLAHPHVNEQPFTRSLSGVMIPEGLGRHAAPATVEFSIHDQRAADSAADIAVEHDAVVASGPESGLRQPGQIGVVPQDGRQPKSLLAPIDQAVVLPSVDLMADDRST